MLNLQLPTWGFLGAPRACSVHLQMPHSMSVGQCRGRLDHSCFCSTVRPCRGTRGVAWCSCLCWAVHNQADSARRDRVMLCRGGMRQYTVLLLTALLLLRGPEVLHTVLPNVQCTALSCLKLIMGLLCLGTSGARGGGSKWLGLWYLDLLSVESRLGRCSPRGRRLPQAAVLKGPISC